MSTLSHTADHAHHGDQNHDHPPFLAHHFDTPEQQYASSKLGMWVFLGTELLMFGGLFCAYAVYRHNHPEVFEYAHTYLNKWWGAINTVILLVSSFTMAWAVRCSQLGHRTGLCVLLALTLLGGAGFMGIKAIEYSDKWKHHLFPGRANLFNREYTGDHKPDEHHAHGDHPSPAAPAAAAAHATGDNHATGDGHAAAPADPHAGSASHAVLPPASASAAPARALNPVVFVDPHAGASDAAKIVPTSNGPAGLAQGTSPKRGHLTFADLATRDQVRVNTFFSIYFIMTGLHGLHVLVGMGLIAWVLIKSAAGIFGPTYYTPVDLVGLYWHLVDLIWIFLFPLLYLIH
ncbi:MAG: cytochrome c oxidase subunit 3 [Phycisphaerales bacterium]|nr:cytochrome c oxidase subunit 3 [Phycisphaerales bacterium]